MNRRKLIAAAVLVASLALGAATFHGPDNNSILEPTSLVVSTGGYSSGHLIGTGPLTFETAARATGQGGMINSACLLSKDTDGPAVDLVLFSSFPSSTLWTDRAAFTPADADLAKIIGMISFAAASWKSFADNQAVCNTAVEIPYNLPASTSLYGVLVARGLLTPASTSDYTLRLMVKRS